MYPEPSTKKRWSPFLSGRAAGLADAGAGVETAGFAFADGFAGMGRNVVRRARQINGVAAFAARYAAAHAVLARSGSKAATSSATYTLELPASRQLSSAALQQRTTDGLGNARCHDRHRLCRPRLGGLLCRFRT